ncbi:PREDICTED: uncharacterized protein LOC109234879 [Nicotiana attenuata]|uniref:uncharacterized protein LOC109234879 n=1 Tax=Nicotiana attenuata TaxID=49451 RepID=UPI0009047910|nr:PREDICTED: uncharacterized protein LOC109234879 [Nicotiana attenuata]
MVFHQISSLQRVGDLQLVFSLKVLVQVLVFSTLVLLKLLPMGLPRNNINILSPCFSMSTLLLLLPILTALLLTALDLPTLQGPSLRRPLVIGKAANGLYFLHSAGRSSPVSISKFVPVSNSIICNVPGQVPCSTSHSVISSSHVILLLLLIKMMYFGIKD